MNTKLFVSNLPYSLGEANVEQLFSSSGKVLSVRMAVDSESGRKRGFAFVEMQTPEQAQTEIENVYGQEVEGRKLVVEICAPRTRHW